MNYHLLPNLELLRPEGCAGFNIITFTHWLHSSIPMHS